MSTEQHYVSLPIAKSYFHSGTLKGFRLLKAAISLLHNGAASEAWHIILITEKDRQIWLCGCNAPGEPRYFKSLNSAVNILEKIGFKVNQMGYVHGMR